MPTLTISVTSLQTACAECADALAAEDYTTAAVKYRVAVAINSGLEMEAGTADGDRVKRRDTLEELGRACGVIVDDTSTAVVTSEKRLIKTRVNFR